MEKVLQLPQNVFLSAGGSGHSLTNTLWFISTRPDASFQTTLSPTSTPKEEKFTNCACPSSCTSLVQNADADGATCKERITWLIHYESMNEKDACHQVGLEFPNQCAACDPIKCKSKQERSQLTCGCKTCNEDALNNNADEYSCKDRIQRLINVHGDSELVACSKIGGLEYRVNCASCDPDRCIPFRGFKQTKEDSDCHPCDTHVCRGPLNRCMVYNTPYLCLEGPNKGGCSSLPWTISEPNTSGFCFQCCKLFPHCSQ